ncbi:MAG: GNAT family acetyltransferase [Pseudomonadota bacterium]
MPGAPVLRLAIQADAPAVIALWSEAGLIASHNLPEQDFARALASASSDIILALEADQVVGSVMVGDDGHRAWIYYLAVAPDNRREHLGSRLIQAAETWASDRGARKIQLMIRPGNEAVSQFYDRQDYAETPRIVMAKWLDPEMAVVPTTDKT